MPSQTRTSCSKRCPSHFKDLSRMNGAPIPKIHRSGRSRPIEGSFRLTYGLFATGTHPVALVSPPVGAPLPGAYFEGDRRPVPSDREGSGRPLRLIYAVCSTVKGTDRRDRRSSGITCRSFNRRSYPVQRISIHPRSKVPGHRDAFGVFS